MKRTTKQLLALLLAGTMITLFAACGGSETESSDKSGIWSGLGSDDDDDPDSDTEEEGLNSEYAKLTPSDGLEFELNDFGTAYSVVGFGTCTDTEIVIPAEYEGLPVTTIGPRAFSKYNNEPNDYRAFTKIYLPETITYIKDRAFWGCDSLEEVHIYSTSINVSEYAFWECTSLSYIDLTKISMRNKYIFSDCTSFQEFTIPERTVSVGKGLLNDCTSLKSLTIPASMTELPVNMCTGCTDLTDIYYNGTIEQWSNIVQNSADRYDTLIETAHLWWDETGEFTVHCTDGDIPKAEAVVAMENYTLAQLNAAQ